MLKTTSLGVDNPKRSHIDPILRKYIWVDSQKKKYIKEKNQFKQVTKYKGQYVVKKQKAGSASQKGGVKLANECNDPKDDTFFYKTEFTQCDKTYDAYIIYFKNFKNNGLSNLCKTQINKYYNNNVIYTDLNNITDDVNITENNDKTRHILRIFKKYSLPGSYNPYKMYKLSVEKSKFFVKYYYEKKETIRIYICNDGSKNIINIYNIHLYSILTQSNTKLEKEEEIDTGNGFDKDIIDFIKELQDKNTATDKDLRTPTQTEVNSQNDIANQEIEVDSQKIEAVTKISRRSAGGSKNSKRIRRRASRRI